MERKYKILLLIGSLFSLALLSFAIDSEDIDDICSNTGSVLIRSGNGWTCGTVNTNETNISIFCPSGYVLQNISSNIAQCLNITTINGTNGINGLNGTNGINGTNVNYTYTDLTYAKLDGSNQPFTNQVQIQKNNDDYTSSDGTGSHIFMNNPTGSQNVVMSVIGGSPVAKWRTDNAGNINWVSYASASDRGHYFFIGGDYGDGGKSKLKVMPNGVAVGDEITGVASSHLFEVYDTSTNLDTVLDSDYNYFMSNTYIGASADDSTTAKLQVYNADSSLTTVGDISNFNAYVDYGAGDFNSDDMYITVWGAKTAPDSVEVVSLNPSYQYYITDYTASNFQVIMSWDYIDADYYIIEVNDANAGTFWTNIGNTNSYALTDSTFSGWNGASYSIQQYSPYGSVGYLISASVPNGTAFQVENDADTIIRGNLAVGSASPTNQFIASNPDGTVKFLLDQNSPASFTSAGNDMYMQLVDGSARESYFGMRGGQGFFQTYTAPFRIETYGGGLTSVTANNYLGAVGSVGTPTYSFASDPNTGMYDVSGDILGFVTGGTNRLNLSTTFLKPGVPIYGLDGSTGSPSYTFGADTDTGFYRVGTNSWGMSAGGAGILSVNTLHLYQQKGQRSYYQTKNAKYTVALTDYMINVNQSDVNLTLPTAVGSSGVEFVLMNTGNGIVIVNSSLNEKINGNLKYTLNTNESMIVVSDNVGWQVVASNKRTYPDKQTFGTALGNVTISPLGNIALNGNATVWNDLQFPVTSLRINPFTSKPDEDTENLTFLFDDSTTETLRGIGQSSHTQKNNTPLNCHVHWIQSNNGNVTWNLVYSLSNLGSTSQTWYEANATGKVFSYSSGNLEQLSYFPPTVINVTSPSAIFKFNISRLGGVTNDTYIGDAKFQSFDCHYEIDKLGSDYEYN